MPSGIYQRQSMYDRFWSKVDKSKGYLGCWNWTGGFLSTGYGQFTINHNTFLAHRVSFEMMYGSMIDQKPCVCHTCDNRKCVNPLHLFIGTYKDNRDDCIKKNRNCKGSMFRHSKLTEGQIPAIRNLIDLNLPLEEIAKSFNVNRGTIHNIKTRTTWKHV